jgi:putative spermidine/putrescine transport system permease protein
LAPACALLLLLFVLPIGYTLLLSVTDPHVSLTHFQRIFSVPLYRRVMTNTFITSLLVTLCSLLIAYPIAYVMARRDDWLSRTLLVAVMLCFWTGFVVRTYAWMIILGNKGPVASLISLLGLGQPPRLLFTSFASTLGMVHILLPFMVLTLYGVMQRIDPHFARAAASLGARPATAFLHVYLPLSLPGVINGGILVFTVCLGFFITPALLGSPQDMMISQVINQQIEEMLAWGFASALAVVLIVATAIVLSIYNRFAGLDRLWG